MSSGAMKDGESAWEFVARQCSQQAAERQRAQEQQAGLADFARAANAGATLWGLDARQAAQTSAARRLEDVQTMLERGAIGAEDAVRLLDIGPSGPCAPPDRDRVQALELQNQKFECLVGQQRAEIQALKSELAEERMSRRGKR